MNDSQLLTDLAERLAERGGQSTIAAALGVGKSTVARWLETGEITDSHRKLLRLYFYGEIPFDHIRPDQDLSSILKFTSREFEVIRILAARVGLSPGQWIAEQIRTIIAFRSQPQITAMPDAQKVAEDPTEYRTGAKSSRS